MESTNSRQIYAAHKQYSPNIKILHHTVDFEMYLTISYSYTRRGKSNTDQPCKSLSVKLIIIKTM